MIAETWVGPSKAPDDAKINLRSDNYGALVTHEMSGKHFEQNLRGRLFVYHVASQALVLPATTGGMPTIWNNSTNYLFVPVALRISFVSGTTVIGSVVLAETLTAGFALGTAAPIVTATKVDGTSAFRGAGNKTNMYFSPTTNTFTAAPAILAAGGLNLGAAAPTGTGTYETKFDGSLIYGPGTALSIGYSVTTSTALFHITLWGLELPIPQNA